MRGLIAGLLILGWFAAGDAWGQVERVWLTPNSSTGETITVNWTTKTPGPSRVVYETEDAGGFVFNSNLTTLHQVEIPLEERDCVYRYSVESGDQKSEEFTFKSFPREELRIAVVADWQSKPKLDVLLKEDVHLLLTAGDNINNLWGKCGAGTKDCIQPYEQLIDTYPELFRSTLFLPISGNHDREIRPRGKQPPEEPVYDIEATAFRRFFALPDQEWKWHLDVPGFDLRIIGLDLHHISDFGTTWQTCHDFSPQGAQFQWYKKLMEQPPKFVITLYNERNASVRSQHQGAWQEQFQKGTLCITGFGYFAERAEFQGVPYYNTSLSGTGAQYKDPHSKFLAGEDSYLLLTLDKSSGRLAVEIKNLQGKVLDHQEYSGR